MTRIPITRALISVYDKSGLEDLARGLHDRGAQIVSTGSTARTIEAAGIPVTRVEDLTGFPECLDGRVKTLHPRVHAGLLADLANPAHEAQLRELDIAPFQLLVSNLYPFERTVASGAAADEIIEQIDIGGPAMVRAAAKNHGSVAVVTSPAQYPETLKALAEGGFTGAERRRLAAAAYAHTAAYDAAVASWFASSYAPDETAAQTGWPEVTAAVWTRAAVLRYGENPHQQAALYKSASSAAVSTSTRPPQAAGGSGGSSPQETPAGAPEEAVSTSTRPPQAAGAPEEAVSTSTTSPQAAGGSGGSSPRAGIANAETLHGKAMSYNNYVDADAARRAVYDFAEPCVAIIKHSNPCGIAIGADIAAAHAKAHACDPVSAYGGVIAANGVVTAAMATQVTETFAEVVIAPDFEPEALEILTGRWKNIRLLRCPPPATAAVTGMGGATARSAEKEWRQVSGGMLMQSADLIDAPGDDPRRWELKAGEAVDPATLADLAFAWRACRAVKSNAILLASGGASVGVGMGQVNRVDSARLAVARAGNRAAGSVAASDAFFPFSDGFEILAEAGVRAVVEPGGSVRDDSVVAAAAAAGVTLYFTGVRHFYH